MHNRCAVCLGGRILLVLAAGVTAGCTLPPGYTSSAIRGEISYLRARVPIEEGLDDATLTDEERDKLAFVIRARDYGEQVIGLRVENNYQEFVNLHGEPLAWNLTASSRVAFEPYEWQVPIIGSIPFLGFFDLDEAKDYRDELVADGYDTFIYEIDTFALAYLPDPVTSGVLRRPYRALADVVMHELLHNTVYHETDTVYNESLAVWVGRTAGMAFMAQEFGADSPLIEEAEQAYEDQDRFNAFLAGLIDELNVLYEGDASADEKLADRVDIFDAARTRFAEEVLPLMHNQEGYGGFVDFPFNNAYLVVNARYNSDLDLFEAIHDMTGRNWGQSLSLFTQAANADDPIAYLEDLLP